MGDGAYRGKAAGPARLSRLTRLDEFRPSAYIAARAFLAQLVEQLTLNQ